MAGDGADFDVEIEVSCFCFLFRRVAGERGLHEIAAVIDIAMHRHA